MKKIKVLIVITKTNWGGAQRYVYDIASSLSKDIFDVTVAGGGTGEEDAQAGTLTKKLGELKIRFIFIPHLIRDVSWLKEFLVLTDLIRIFKNEGPDVIHLNSSKIGALGSLAGRITGIKKIIFTAHGFAFDENRPWHQKISIAFVSWLTVFLSTETIVILEKDVDRIRKWPFISDGKIRLIRNGIGPTNFLSKEDARKNILDNEVMKDLNPDTRWVGTIGELHRNKGLEYALRGFAKSNPTDAVLVIIGEGEERQNVEKLIMELKMEGKIFLAGYKENASRLLKAFDVFIMTSIKEGFPYAILEAGLASLPVLSTNAGGISEIIENDKTGILIRQKNIEEISRGINYLLTNAPERERLARALYDKTASFFSLEDEIKEVEELYRN